MQIPIQVKPAAWGALGGALALAVIGFGWGGWVTASTAETLATEKANKAVISVLAPICVENFNRSSDAGAQLVALKSAKSWEQGDFVAKQGWAVMPGVKTVNSDLANRCAELIIGKKS